MRSILPLMPQGIHIPAAFNRFAHAVIHYGQLLIYFTALVVLFILYNSIQRMLMFMLENEASIKLPE